MFGWNTAEDREKRCDLHNRFILTLCALEHFIFTGICVRSQMSHIRNIHNALYIVAHIPQSLFQNVFHDVGTQVANVRIMVNRGATGIHFNNVGGIGFEQFLLMRKGVIKIHKQSS